MKTMRLRKATRIAAAVAASLGAVTLGSLAASSSAHADPGWGPSQNPLVAVGSNTIEDLMDAFSGGAPTPNSGAAPVNYHYFTPLSDSSGASATFEQVYSWDAVNQATNTTDCISTKPGFAPIARPNGSGDGRKALSDEISGVAWSKASASGCGSVIPTGMIDLARSSSPPTGGNCTFSTSTTLATCLAWIDFAHDAVSYAYDILSGSSTTASQVDALTNAQLTTLYSSTSTGTATFNGVTYAACLPQLGSGTESFFVNNELNGGAGLAGGTTTAEAAAGAAKCENFEENGATTFQSFAQTALGNDSTDSPAPTVAVTPFSVGSWIAQNNNFAFNRSTAGVAAGVGLGCIDSSCSGTTPYDGSAPSETPDATFYGNSLYGRDLFLIANFLSLDGKAGQFSGPMRRIFGFLGTNWAVNGNFQTSTNSGTGVICTAPWQTTYLSDFGFTSPTKGACGNESITEDTTGTGS